MVSKRNVKYIEIAVKLKEMLASRQEYHLPLASERELAKKFEVSRDTIRKALALLDEQNIISKKNRSGSYPLPPTINRDLHGVKSIAEDMESLHLDYSIQIINLSVVKSLPKEFLATDKMKFHKIERAILISGTPTVYEEHYIDASIFPKFPIEAASEIFKFVEEQCGLSIRDSYQDISIKKPTSKALSALGIDSPLLLYVHSNSTLSDGRVFQYTTQFFHPNYNFKLHLNRSK